MSWACLFPAQYPAVPKQYSGFPPLISYVSCYFAFDSWLLDCWWKCLLSPALLCSPSSGPVGLCPVLGHCPCLRWGHHSGAARLLLLSENPHIRNGSLKYSLSSSLHLLLSFIFLSSQYRIYLLCNSVMHLLVTEVICKTWQHRLISDTKKIQNWCTRWSTAAWILH